jgi:hypothetical protein
MQILAIDPGTTGNMGWACFLHGHLVNAGVDGPSQILHYIIGADVIVFEHPEIYPARMGKGDPNRLLGLVKQIGFIQGRAKQACIFHEYLPCQWKGQLPKHIVQRRARATLTDLEGPIPPACQHDTWDAIALGLVFLRRLRLA